MRNLLRGFASGFILSLAAVLVLSSCGGNNYGLNSSAAGVVSTLVQRSENAYFYGVVTDSHGNVYTSGSSTYCIRKYDTVTSVWSVFAGKCLDYGYNNGTGTDARFAGIYQMAIDSSDNLYVVDSYRIRKVSTAGVVTTLAGGYTQGSADGTGADASFSQPIGIAWDPDNDVLYIGDSNNHAIRKVTMAGVVTTVSDSAGNPYYLAYHAADHTLYISDGGSGHITQTDVTDSFPSAVTDYWNPGGVATQGIALDSGGYLYVNDTTGNKIWKVAPGGGSEVVWVGSGVAGETDANGTSASFNNLKGLAVDSSGNLYVGESSYIRKVTAAKDVTHLYYSLGAPKGIARDSSGNIFYTDNSQHTVMKVTASGEVSLVAGDTGTSGSSLGTGAAANFNSPSGLAIDSSGNLFVADMGNNQIRKVTPAGVVTIAAGTTGGYLDGVVASAKLNQPSDLVFDASGNMYVSDQGNSLIRKITPGGVVSTFVGSFGAQGWIDGTGTDAVINAPQAMAMDSSGDFMLCDYSNYLMRKITAAGVVTTVAGLGGLSGGMDGTGPNARLYSSSGIASDGGSGFYMVDNQLNTIRKVTSDGTVTTVAGPWDIFNSAHGYVDGVGSAARFYGLYRIVGDGSGNYYVTDSGNHAIRKVSGL
ncbi:hypothetical protein K2X33_13125 [bacterium]|nr:hypothetical protein [bacterium]